MKKLLYLNKQWLEKEYLQKGLSSRKIAKSLGMSKATILRQLKRFDIPRHSHGHPRGKMKPDIKLICLECGKEFYVDNHDENRRKFCSQTCHLINYHRNKPPKNAIDDNFYINNNGYIAKHGSEGNGFHREIIEKKIGRKIKNNECVHHIDLDKKNCNENNLILMTKSKHQLLHGQLNYVISELVKKDIIKFNLKKKEYFISKKEF